MSEVLGVAAVLVAGLVLARLALRVIQVDGASMEPTLPAGSRVLALRWWPRRWLRPGQVVLLRARSGLIVKRVAHVAGETVVVAPRDRSYVTLEMLERQARAVRLGPGEIFVLGDNPAGIDSRDWGPLRAEAVTGLVLPRTALPQARPEQVRP